MEEISQKRKQQNELPDWMPKRVINISKRLSGLAPGTKHVLTITVREDTIFYTCTEMSGTVEH